MKKLLLLFIFSIFFINSSFSQEVEPKNPYELSSFYMKKKDYQNAYKTLKKLYEKEDIKGTYLFGKFFINKNTPFYNPKQAFDIFMENADKNDAPSQLMVGKFFLLGEGTNKDYELAIHYFTLASKQKNGDANCYIAYMYANGFGVLPNFGRANVFAKSEYKKGNKLCVKVWNDFNLSKYPQDKGFKFGDYLEPVE